MIVKTILYMLAHPDDEVMCLQSIMHMPSETRTYVLYLTDGGPKKSPFKASQRKLEAIKVSSLLGYFGNTIFFGESFGIEDGKLSTLFGQENYREVLRIVKTLSPDYVISTTLEGGHQDHDAAYLITKKVASTLSLQFLSYPCYCQSTFLPFYSVMKTSAKIRMKSATYIQRIRMCFMAFQIMLKYRTQMKTWVGIGIQILLKYLFGNLALEFDRNCKVADVKFFLFETRRTFSSADLKNFEKEIDSWNVEISD